MANGETGSRPTAVPAGLRSPAPHAAPRPADSGPAGSTAAGTGAVRAYSAGSLESLVARYGRVIIAGLLLIVVMAGVRVAAPAVAGTGPLRRDALALGVAGEVLLAGLEIALLVRGRRAPQSPRLARLLRTGLQRLAGVLMVAIAAIALTNLLATKHPGKIMQAFRGTAPKEKPGSKPRAVRVPKLQPLHLGFVPYIVLALLVLAAVAVCVVLIMRTRVRQLASLDDEDPGGDAEELRQAVESGRLALHAVDDARAAIIACYVAMERSLERAGTARAAAETPDELLARASSSGLLRGPAAGRLTVLFYEARFSTHGLPGTVRDDARRALDAISAELARRAPVTGLAGLAPDGAAR